MTYNDLINKLIDVGEANLEVNVEDADAVEAVLLKEVTERRLKGHVRVTHVAGGLRITYTEWA